jgi:hypothetical protein
MSDSIGHFIRFRSEWNKLELTSTHWRSEIFSREAQFIFTANARFILCEMFRVSPRKSARGITYSWVCLLFSFTSYF